MTRLSLFILFLTAAAVSAGAVSIPLDGAAGHALVHNQTLAAARLRIDEARGRVLGAGRLRNPELEIELSQNVHAGEHALRVELLQRFPITARLQLEKAVSRAQLAAAEAEVRDAARKLAAEVQTGAVKIMALGSQRDLRQQQLANSRQQFEFIGKRVAAGEASSVDASLIDLETRQLSVELLQLETQRAALLGELRPLLGVDASEPLEITGALAAPAVLPIRPATSANRADLEAAEHSAEAARQAIGLARAERWEDIGVGLSASGDRSEDAPDGLSNDYFLGLRISLPLPLWNRNQGRLVTSKAAAARAALETNALALTIRNEAEAARAEMAALARLIHEMDAGLLPVATQVEDQLLSAYNSAQTPFTEVLRARTRRLELAQRRVDALRDFHLARVRYESATGRHTPAQGKAGK